MGILQIDITMTRLLEVPFSIHASNLSLPLALLAGHCAELVVGAGFVAVREIAGIVCVGGGVEFDGVRGVGEATG